MSGPVSLRPTYIKGYELSYRKLADRLGVTSKTDPKVLSAVEMTVHDWIGRDQYLFIGGATERDATTNQPRFVTVVVLDEDYDEAKLKNRITPDFVVDEKVKRLALGDEVRVWERCI
ncbi:hypothetical protein BT69DRAFT_1361264 [Atractiella rhizophila]|nr:hypothetical protein BT69DRAFT_1361264 [Atractiella rhizophila]